MQRVSAHRVGSGSDGARKSQQLFRELACTGGGSQDLGQAGFWSARVAWSDHTYQMCESRDAMQLAPGMKSTLMKRRETRAGRCRRIGRG